MTAILIKYYKRSSIFQEVERFTIPFQTRKEFETFVSFKQMRRLHQGRYDNIEAYGKQTAYDEYQIIEARED